jgi:hypothetical protein
MSPLYAPRKRRYNDNVAFTSYPKITDLGSSCRYEARFIPSQVYRMPISPRGVLRGQERNNRCFNNRRP